MKRSEQLLEHADELARIGQMIPQDAGWDRLKSAERAARAVADELAGEEAEAEADKARAAREAQAKADADAAAAQAAAVAAARGVVEPAAPADLGAL